MSIGQGGGAHNVLVQCVVVFASSSLFPFICSDGREAASYFSSHDEEQDATSMQALTVTWSCGVTDKM